MSQSKSKCWYLHAGKQLSQAATDV
jgi:hypothetical protein